VNFTRKKETMSSILKGISATPILYGEIAKIKLKRETFTFPFSNYEQVH
jgi:hypothetical protein